MAFKEISKGFLTDLDTLISLADEKNPGLCLQVHSDNVRRYSKIIYDNLPDYEKVSWKIQEKDDKGIINEMMIPSEFVEKAGYYHDIGKTIVVKFHKGMLEKEIFTEYDKVNIREHTSFGVICLQIIASTNSLTDIDTPLFKLMSEACLYHHERIDGSGYLKMEGWNIPKIGNLIAVADCYSAGIEKRVYAEAKETEIMLRELKCMPLNQTYVNALERGLFNS